MHTHNQIIKLSDLPQGKKAIFLANDDHPLFEQILNMGCVPGEEIIIKRVGAFGDPIAFEVSEVLLSIRLEDAQNILVKIQEHAEDRE